MRHHFTKTQRQHALTWIVTLESGNYEQGRFVLRDYDNKCCCLGVWCDIHAPDKWEKKSYPNSQKSTPTTYLHQGNHSYPNLEIIRSGLGLQISDTDYLVDLNDYKNLSFKGIAKVLRRWYGLD